MGSYNVQNGQILVCCYQTIFEVEYNLGRQSVYVSEILYTIELVLGIDDNIDLHLYIQEDDISYRWLMIGESADTTQKGVGALVKN